MGFEQEGMRGLKRGENEEHNKLKIQDFRDQRRWQPAHAAHAEHLSQASLRRHFLRALATSIQPVFKVLKEKDAPRSRGPLRAAAPARASTSERRLFLSRRHEVPQHPRACAGDPLAEPAIV